MKSIWADIQWMQGNLTWVRTVSVSPFFVCVGFYFILLKAGKVIKKWFMFPSNHSIAYDVWLRLWLEGLYYMRMCAVCAQVYERQRECKRESGYYWTWKHSLWSLSTGCQIKQRRREKMICVCNWRAAEKEEKRREREGGGSKAKRRE